VQSEVAGRAPEIGCGDRTRVTPVGGDIMFIEAIRMPGKGQITLTGQLGDVMKESAQAAWSLLRARRQRRSASRPTRSRNQMCTCTSAAGGVPQGWALGRHHHRDAAPHRVVSQAGPTTSP